MVEYACSNCSNRGWVTISAWTFIYKNKVGELDVCVPRLTCPVCRDDDGQPRGEK